MLFGMSLKAAGTELRTNDEESLIHEDGRSVLLDLLIMLIIREALSTCNTARLALLLKKIFGVESFRKEDTL